MKLRIRGNFVRLRLTQSEVARLAETGAVEETVEFGLRPEQRFVYALEKAAGAETVRADFDGGSLRVWIPEAEAEKWTSSNQVGIEARQPLGGEKELQILIEKDFACLAERPGEDESDAFPNPSEGTAC